mmetsp:Transcript_11034/g.25932  ORF Transcript_11034/g.25932 Transcript_11034/m.25932 type:complete len:246 (-) Transcript_11034:82-819(-)
MASRFAARRSMNIAVRSLCSGPAGLRMGKLTGLAATGREFSTRKVPTQEDAAAMPVLFSELPNDTLIILAEQGNHQACAERLVRHIMTVDSMDHHTASKHLHKIKSENKRVVWWMTLPYKVGMTTAVVAGIGSIPMVFSGTAAKWFNSHFVTMEVPEPADLQTILEVGSWTWNWMEPPLGTASFVLLTLQFARAQMLNMDLTPYTNWVQKYRARRLVSLFPQYDKNILSDYARTSSLRPMKHRHA